MKKALFLFAVLSLSAFAQAQKKPMKEFVGELMSRMTLEEKIGQLNLMVAGVITTGSAVHSGVETDIAEGRMGGIFNVKGLDKIKPLQDVAVKQSRLGIPLLVGMDVIHGYETIFPIPLALSCTWNMDAIEQSARIAAKEASADGINWTFSPMVDISLDARWGRIAESGGEDPYLGARIAEAMIRGYQGNYSSKENVMACVKHYALYGAVESGKDYNTVDMSRMRMYNQFFEPYKAGAKAGAGSFMTSFNVVEGVPATANKWLIKDVLRKEWGYDGLVVTDYASIEEMITHGTAKDLKDASEQAMRAGTDMDMVSYGFVKHLARSVKEGKVSEKDIDEACRRVLEAKYRLGLFADPYRYCDPKRRKKDIFTEENRRIARDIAAQTFVLLKNENNLLPLRKQGTVALIGPLAHARNNMSGMWSVAAVHDKYPTLKEGFEQALAGKAKLLYAQGSNIEADATRQAGGEFDKPIARGDDEQMKREALDIAKQADVIVCAMGESADMSGESSSRTHLEMPEIQMTLLKELCKLGKPVVLLNFSGRPTVLKWENDNVPAILNVWFGGSETAYAICDVLFGDKVPVGKLTTSMPFGSGQEPLYYNHLNTGRPVAEGTARFLKYQSNYLDVPNGALFPFGYGLSYTTFRYSPLRLSAASMKADGSIRATVTVTNVGERDADEVVQLYIRDLVGSIARPVKELKGFQRIHIAKGESKDVEFIITAEQLKFYNSDLQYVLEPGDFDIMIGGNSRDVQVARLTVEE